MGQKISEMSALPNPLDGTEKVEASQSDGGGGFVGGSVPLSNIKTFARTGDSSFTQVSLSADQIFPQATETKIEFDTADTDPGGYLDAVNNRLIPTVAGLYLVTLDVSLAAPGPVAGERIIAFIYKNGVSISIVTDGTHVSSTNVIQTVTLVEMNGSTDYLEGWVRKDTTADLEVKNNSTFLRLTRLSRN